jgi:hypothetical protein
MIAWKWLLIIDAATMFIITMGTTLGVVMLEVGKNEQIMWRSIIGATLGALVACANQLRARLALPPPTSGMIAAAVAATAPIAARVAAEAAAPAAALAAAPAAARAAAPEAAAIAAPAAAAAAAPAAAREAAPEAVAIEVAKIQITQ